MNVNKLRIRNFIMKTFVLNAAILTVCSAGIFKNFVDDSDDNYCGYREDMLNADPKNLTYRLYTRKNYCISQTLKFCERETIKQSNFDVKKPLVVIVHGQSCNSSDEMPLLLVSAFLNAADFNVISLDWSALSYHSMFAHNQVTTAKISPAVGRGLGIFIRWLTTLGVSYDQVHLVGFGNGGHIIGNAGRVNNGKIGRLTALNPLTKNWKKSNDRINKNDGKYVEVIHTDSCYGYSEPCGHVDFYPNGGDKMPGCEGRENDCSHARAYFYMTATVEHNHIKGKKCKNKEEVTNNRCCGEELHMGNACIVKTGLGIYRANTKENYPF